MSMRNELQEVAGRKIRFNVQPLTQALSWASQNRESVKTILHEHGALLIRGLRFHGTKQFGQFLQELFGEDLAEYTYRSTPRTKLGGNVYTATEYHPSETIPQHNESSYANVWAMHIGFFCMIPPAAGMGGATPLADSRAVLARIPPEIVEKFETKQLQYVRNYGNVDLPWSEVFQTDDKQQVEAFCESNNISFEWTENNGLRTKQITPATAVHPVTGEKIWFNQAHLFHVSGLAEQVARDMLSVYRVEDLPRNVYFGDGTPIDVEDLDRIRAAYDEVKFHFDWQKDDIVLLDNMLYTHGRQPYSGARKILVGMAKMHGRA
ncbi:TauD/TfdA family dioxygenase [Montanilutibacter psychrotolerans]|uniref:TauD/TfdA family dioxygenase n=1 Tax=Montanilutibacter psychrotolerans TaxID=1327343 RepID=A0A3M8SWU5_9GAMM|nr:TauD/TfdA family dioxygenase [Lysobacter psychrotolerans]RNF83320.1 TauD/TfdA family dioxygenase [Lysobacter psychrotolerans]